MPTSSETGIHPSSSYNLRSRPLPKTTVAARKSAREDKENARPGPVTRATKNAAKSKIPVPGNSRIPLAKSAGPRTTSASARGKALPAAAPAPAPAPAHTKRRKVPDFEKLHKTWSKKFEQGKAVAKKPCTQSQAFDLTRPGTRFKQGYFDGSVERKGPRHIARTGRDAGDFGDDFEVDPGALSRILNADGLEEEPEQDFGPSASTRATLAGTGRSELPGRVAAGRQTLGALPSRGVGRTDNAANVATSRDWNRKSLGCRARAVPGIPSTRDRQQKSAGHSTRPVGRKSLLDEQKAIGLQFEASADSLASILNSTGVKHSALGNGGRQTIAGMSARHRQSGRFNPNTGRASIYYHRPKNYDMTKVYSEFAKKTLSRLTLDGKSSAAVNSALIDSLVPDNRGSIYTKQGPDQSVAAGAAPHSSVNASRSPVWAPSAGPATRATTPRRVAAVDPPRGAPAASHKTPAGTASRVPNPRFQELQQRQDLSCSPALRVAVQTGLTPARRVPFTPGGQSAKNVRWADVLSPPQPQDHRTQSMSTKDVVAVLNFGDEGNERDAPQEAQGQGRLEEVEKLEAETAVNRQRLNEMEEIERQLEMEIARLHEAEASDGFLAADQIPTKQSADHVDPVRLPKEASHEAVVPGDASIPTLGVSSDSRGQARGDIIDPSRLPTSSRVPQPVEAWADDPLRKMPRAMGNTGVAHRAQGEPPGTIGRTGHPRDGADFRGIGYLDEGMQSLSLNLRTAAAEFNVSGPLAAARGHQQHLRSAVSRDDQADPNAVSSSLMGRLGNSPHGEGLLQQERDMDFLLLENTECFRGILPPFLPTSREMQPKTSLRNMHPEVPQSCNQLSTAELAASGSAHLLSIGRVGDADRIHQAAAAAAAAVQATRDTMPSSHPPTLPTSLNSSYPAAIERIAPSTSSLNGQPSGELSSLLRRQDAGTHVPAPETVPVVMSLQTNASIPQVPPSPPVPAVANVHLYNDRTASVHSSYDAYPSAAQIHTPQPRRRRGVTFLGPVPDISAVPMPLCGGAAVPGLPPPIQTPLAMRHSSLTQPHRAPSPRASPEASLAQPSGRSLNLAPPSARPAPAAVPLPGHPASGKDLHRSALQENHQHPGIASAARPQHHLSATAPAVPAGRGVSVVPASFGGSVAPASLGVSVAPASLGAPMTTTGLDASRVPAHLGATLASASLSSSMAPASLRASVVPEVKRGSAVPVSLGGTLAPAGHGASMVLASLGTSLEPTSLSSSLAPASLAAARAPASLGRRATDRSFLQRPAQDTTTLESEGSLSLSGSLRGTVQQPSAVQRLQVNSEKDSVGQLFHHVLLDEECALYACRLRGRFAPEPLEPRPQNPIAKVLLSGDDMHFVPIKDLPLPTVQPSGSAFSSYYVSTR